MGARHRQRKPDKAGFATESRELRKAQHRAQRHAVHQTLHVAAVDGELEDVVLPLPKPTRARIEPGEREQLVGSNGSAFKPWKLPFWKRRVNQRRAKALAYRSFAAE